MLKRILIIFFKSKWVFTKPKKRDLLIYDVNTLNSNFVNYLFPKKKFEIIHTRYETINFFIIFSALFNFGLKNLVENYKRKYFEIVSPKIIYTSIDYRTDFYKLKKIYPHATYIADQRGISKIVNATWPNDFYWDIKRYNKSNKKKAFADVLFVFGENEKKRLINIIDGKYYILGNTKNNAYKSNSKIIKKKEITYICSGLWQPSWNRQCRTFKLINKYCEKYKIKLNFIPKHVLDPQSKFKENYYRKKLGKGSWSYINHTDTDVYKFLMSQELILFAHSTLGYEIMAHGIKVAVLSNYFPEKMSTKMYKDQGPFWTNKDDYVSISNLIKKVFKMKKKNWEKIYKSFSYEIMNFDKNNLTKKKIIKNILKK
jgi:hypothetical protein